ncbi:MAG: phosphatidate cytidylyltransferase [Fibrobacterota bacterium]
MSELIKRILFAVAAIPVTVFFVWQGGQLFRGFTLLLLLGAGVEYYFLTRAKGIHAYLPALLLGIAFFGFRHSFILDRPAEALLFPLLSALLLALFVREVLLADPDKAFARAGGTLLGILYIGFFGSYLISISEHPVRLFKPQALLLPFLLAVWGSDSFAYLFGRLFGRRLLAPRLSPKKTWEGLAGSVVGAIAGMLIGRSLLLPAFPSMLSTVLMGFLLGLLGQAGDLFESLLKRSSNVKDSSHLFPGHGGILDRIDALIFCAPAYYYLLFLLK